MNNLNNAVTNMLESVKERPVTVLVTGANGFIGRAICSALASMGLPHIEFDRIFDGKSAARSVQRIEADITDASAVASVFAAHRITHVVHGGGISGPAVAPGNPRLVHTVNILGTLNLLEAAARYRTSRFVLLSSIAAYGNHPTQLPVNEDAPLLAGDFYGASKAAAERVAFSYRKTAGLDIVALRLASVFGPGRRVPCIVGNLFSSVQNGRPAIVSAPTTNPRQLIYIDDCVDAILSSLATSKLPLFAYNIATGRCVSEAEVAAEAVAIDSRVSYKINDDENFFDNHLGALCIDAASRDLGFEARVGLPDGLRKYWDARQHEPV